MSRNTLKLDTSGFDALIRRLENAGADVKTAVDDALSEAGRKIAQDTHTAVLPQNLPAKGEYGSKERWTDQAVIDDPAVEWRGSVASIPVGFDFSKHGAGGFLITGTPKMRPAPMLNKMYRGKKYMADIQDVIGKRLMTHIIRKMEE